MGTNERRQEAQSHACPLCGAETNQPLELSTAEIVAANLTNIMEWRKLRDQDVADGTGLTAHAIGNIRKNRGKGMPRASTLLKLDMLFGVNISERLLAEHELGSKHGFAAEQYGSYSIKKYEFLATDYIFFRRSFDYEDGLVCSHVRIENTRGDNCLRFVEVQRNVSREGAEHKINFRGTISIPSDTGVLQFVSGDAVIKRIHNLKLNVSDAGSTFYGVLQTLNKDTLKGFYPAVTPVFGRNATTKEIKNINSLIGSVKVVDVWDNSIPAILSRIRDEYVS
jgi:transcriptional regulator with XRE-family HTH domain